MNTVFALLILLPSGQLSEAYQFNSLSECQKAITTFSVKGMCVEKSKPDMSVIIRGMGQIFREMEKQ